MSITSCQHTHTQSWLLSMLKYDKNFSVDCKVDDLGRCQACGVLACIHTHELKKETDF
eukprot:c28503_g1_i1 orf=3-173(-)